MSKALKRAAEVTAVIADLKRGTKSLSEWLADLMRMNPARADDGLSHPTIAVRVAIRDGKLVGQVDLYDRTRPMAGLRSTDFRLGIDEACGREVSPRDVHFFLTSEVWHSAITNRRIVKGLIGEARAHGA